MKHSPILLLLAFACGPVLAQERPRAAPITAEESSTRLAEIERQRSATQAALARAEADCYRKFAVNDCLTDARADFRPRISALRKQEVAVRDGDRARKEEERLARLEEQRQTALRSEESARQRATTGAADDRNTEAVQKKQERDAAAPGNAVRAASQRAETERRMSEDAARRAQREVEAPAARQRSEARQQEAEERRAALRRREAERQGKPSATPLPANP
ncbi:hypothetical protein [Xylophilus ampelinus]|uniref:TolA protein n=1 Tax=Xylophilus ampelinus TaxID=54067 RepID=A0A318SL98_9BURK|nr:hypothetical protein [Xylophilus ampelinus]MCS4509049.1 hypothetical protein [Xylophilus ampelinus]PYE79924.1 hypothetical protein DFQ15_101246 [Xylophilus ampelinus]